MEQTFREIKILLDSKQNILLATHQDPDEDALCSALALKLVLEKEGKSADIFCASEIPANIRFLFEGAPPKANVEAQYDLVFGLDYGDLQHLEIISLGLALPEPMITFDHHPLTNQTGIFRIIDPVFSSTCEIVYRFLRANEMEIDKKIATCLLTGIFVDTWSFRHPNTTSKTLEAVAELLLKGALVNKIARFAYQGDMISQPKIWGRALAKMNLEMDLGFVFCSLDSRDMQECGASPDDISGLASFLCMIPGIKFSLVLKELTPGQVDGSFRSLPSGGVDVGVIARALGGGGHRLSAGFKTSSRPDDIIEQIKNLIKAG